LAALAVGEHALASTQMSGWFRYLELMAKSRTGLGSGVLVGGLAAVAFAALALGFFIFAIFIELAERYDPLTAALVLGGLFLLMTIIALVYCLLSRRRTAANAKLELAAHPLWLDPKVVGVGLQIGRAVGWHRVLPLTAVGLLSAGLAKEWLGRDKLETRDTSGEY